MQTAAEDELIQSNPCRIKGAGNAWSAERPTLNLHEVQALAERVPHHYAALVHLLVWTGVRIGEAAAMQRRDLDTASDRPTLTVRERAYRLQSGVIDLDSPKSKAGRRIIPLPPHLVPDIDAHLNQWTGESPSALVFTTSTGGSIISGYSQVFNRALNHIGRPDVRVHDLRHTGMTLAAQAGASVPELMRRLGQSSTTAAEGYLHTTADHGRAVAERMSELAAKSNVIPIRRASGETA
ncbi:MAG: site-specific integrase [Actinomycetota bacterium]|nr:site-specific integrase [Actinomycetota bacterium]